MGYIFGEFKWKKFEGYNSVCICVCIYIYIYINVLLIKTIQLKLNVC